jgi:tungstate transport system substrate-binding protein
MVVMMPAVTGVGGLMSLYRTTLALMITALVCLGPAGAQERTIRVGVPAGPLVQLVQALAPLFQAQTGVAVTAAEMKLDAALSSSGADAALLPSRVLERLQPTERGLSRTVFFGDAVLVGSRAGKARVGGLKDIKTALRWIASARGLYRASSPALGTRELELALWDSIGINVRTRSTWYIEASGDEASTLRQAGSMGAYVLVERMTWAAQSSQQGLEVLVTGDPDLRTSYASHLAPAAPQEASAWHEWLSSEKAQAIIADFRLNGIQVFTPANGRDAEGPPAKT